MPVVGSLDATLDSGSSGFVDFDLSFAGDEEIGLRFSHAFTIADFAVKGGDIIKRQQRTMDVHDYLIDQSGKDWSELLSDWSGVLPSSFTVWLVNRFGDVFIVFEDGSVHMLDVGIGAIKRVADDRDHFATLLDTGDNANNWFMIPLSTSVSQPVSILGTISVTATRCRPFSGAIILSRIHFQ